MIDRLSPESPLLLLLALFALLAGWLALRLPAFAGPNENLHYEYIALVRQTGRLPDLAGSTRPDERHQPPLFYLTAVLLSLPFDPPPLDTDYPPNPYFTATPQGNLNPIRDQTLRQAPVIFAARFASLLFGLVGITAVYTAARLSTTRGVSLLIAALVAFHPTYLHLSATINNDLALTAVAAALTAYTLRLTIADKPPRAYLGWGALFAAALLTKASGIFLALLLPAAAFLLWRRRGQVRPAVHALLWGAAGFLPFWGGWLWFNMIRSDDALGLAPSVPVRLLFDLRPPDFREILPYAGELFRSFWLDWSPGIRGYAPDWFYLLTAALLLIACAGWLHALRDPAQRPFLLLHLPWALALTAAFIAVKTLMVRDLGFLVPEGRWILPAWPSLAWFVGVGWSRWWSETRRERAAAVAAAVPFLAVVMLLLLLYPRIYPRAVPLADAAVVPPDAQPAALQFAGEITLLAANLPEFVLDAESPVTLYWQAETAVSTRYILDAQLLVPEEGEWVRLGSHSSWPGLGLSPTDGWAAGAVLHDELLVHPQGALNGPTAGLLVLSLRDEDGAVPVTHNGADLAWGALPAVVYPAQPLPVPEGALLPAPVVFAETAVLQGLTQRPADDGLEVTLYWQAAAETAQELTSFVHLLDENGAVIAQSDQIPAQSSPATLWRPGDRIRDRHILPGPLPQTGTLLIGLYRTDDVQRLPALQDGQPLPDYLLRVPLP